MNKAELIKKVKESTNTSTEKAKESTEAVLQAIADTLSSGESVQIAGFGMFSVRTRPARTGRSPFTGEEIQISASKTVGFKPAKALKESL